MMFGIELRMESGRPGAELGEVKEAVITNKYANNVKALDALVPRIKSEVCESCAIGTGALAGIWCTRMMSAESGWINPRGTMRGRIEVPAAIVFSDEIQTRAGWVRISRSADCNPSIRG